MKKALEMVLVIAVLMAGLFLLTGCDKKEENVNTIDESVKDNSGMSSTASINSESCESGGTFIYLKASIISEE